MKYSTEIVPMYEAAFYLSRRFTQKRTSNVIRSSELSDRRASDTQWPDYASIIKIEEELDRLFEPDELIKRYFFPLQVMDNYENNDPFSVGDMLLAMHSGLEPPYDIDSAIDYYQTAEKNDILWMFAQFTFAQFQLTNDVTEMDMSVFISIVNKVLVRPEDKWFVIDAATDPVGHLKKIRALVEGVCSYIKTRSRDLSALIESSMRSFCDTERFEIKLRSVFNYGIRSKELEKCEVFPSLMNFKGFLVSYSTEARSIVRMFVGVYADKVLNERLDPNQDDPYIELLKLISDPMRFRVLHDICDKSTFGQDLAEKYGCTRSAMYYHLKKLLNCGLADINLTEYRVLYTMNKRNVYDKLNAMRDYLLNGWKPEDDESHSGSEVPGAENE